MKSRLIKDTTREERAKIVEEALGSMEAAWDGCAPGVAEMYQDYIDGRLEIREVNMAFSTRYVSGRQGPARQPCEGAFSPEDGRA